MRDFWLTRGWYLAFWIAVFVAARLWLVNPIVKALAQWKH